MFALSDKELSIISGFIKERYGVNLTAKSTLIEGRLGCYIHSKGFDSYGAYFEYARNDPTGEEMSNLINRVTTNHTFFMRESNHFEFFCKEVLPWIETLADGEDLRLWCAGCATGEEPYGLSIHILDHMTGRGRRADTTILASDISEKALKIAAEGVYPAENLAGMPQVWLKQYFTDLGDGTYRVTPGLRANVAYKKLNLLDPFVASKPYHTVFCRNVMIYFDADTRLLLVEKLFDVMAPGAYLFIGHSESLATISHGFTYIQPSVYRKPL